jgi:isocitrate/isopropylmalate dehydrogenase
MNGALNQDKVRTRDLGGAAGTREFAAAVIRRIGEGEGG